MLRTVAARGEGTGELIAALDRHHRYLEASGELRRRRRERLREQVIEIVEHKVRRRLWDDPGTVDYLEAQLTLLEEGGATPFAVADDLLGRSTDILTRTTP